MTDTIQLEHLAWVVFDNIMGPGETPPLSGLETYNQIVGCLAGKAYKGLHTRCPVHTSTYFWHAELTKMQGWKAQTPRNVQSPSALFHDVRHEGRVCGVVLCPERKTRCVVERDQLSGTNASSEPKHPGNEMDEGAPTFLQ